MWSLIEAYASERHTADVRIPQQLEDPAIQIARLDDTAGDTVV